jgi:hypothetical protein
MVGVSAVAGCTTRTPTAANTAANNQVRARLENIRRTFRPGNRASNQLNHAEAQISTPSASQITKTTDTQRARLGSMPADRQLLLVQTGQTPVAVEVSDVEGVAIFHQRARAILGISGPEFLRRWDTGEYDGVDDPDVAAVAILIPFARPTDISGVALIADACGTTLAHILGVERQPVAVLACNPDPNTGDETGGPT